jgi:hypothetical protein
VHHHQLAGEKEIKTAIGKLQSNINLLCSGLEVSVKELNFGMITDFTRAVATGLKGFHHRFSQLQKKSTIPK